MRMHQVHLQLASQQRHPQHSLNLHLTSLHFTFSVWMYFCKINFLCVQFFSIFTSSSNNGTHNNLSTRTSRCTLTSFTFLVWFSMSEKTNNVLFFTVYPYFWAMSSVILSKVPNKKHIAKFGSNFRFRHARILKSTMSNPPYDT